MIFERGFDGYRSASYVTKGCTSQKLVDELNNEQGVTKEGTSSSDADRRYAGLGHPCRRLEKLRRAVNRLRCDGHPICSDAIGYFYAARQTEIRAAIAQLTGRISKIAAATKGLTKSYEKK